MPVVTGDAYRLFPIAWNHENTKISTFTKRP